MENINSKVDDRKLREISEKAITEEVITKEEYGFIFSLVKKYRAEAERKLKQIDVLKGQVMQLQLNERIIIDLLNNLVRAAERAKAREETLSKLKSNLDVEVEDDNDGVEDIESK